MDAETDTLRGEVAQLREETQRLQQELAAVKRLLGLGSETAANRKRLGMLQVEGVFIFPHDGDHLDHADLQLFVTNEGGMIKIRNGPLYPLMTLFCDKNGGHMEINSRGSSRGAVKLWIEDNAGRVGVTAKGHRGAAGLHVKPSGGVVVVQAADGKTRGWLRVAEAGGEVYVIGNDDHARVMLWQEDTGGAVTIVGKADQGKADMRILPEAGGGLSVSNMQNTPVFMASAGSPTATVSLMNEQGQFPVLLWADEHGGNIDSVSHDGKSRVRLCTHQVGGSVEIDRAARTLARLSVDKDGGQIVLYDHDGIYVLAAGGGTEGGQVLMQGTGKQHGILLGVGPHGPALEMSRGDKKTSHVQLHTTDHGGMVRVMGNDGLCRAAMNVADSGGQVAVFNDDNQIQATMHTQPTGGVIAAYGFSGQPRAGLSVEDEGGKVQLFDNLGVGRISLSAAKQGGIVILSTDKAPHIVLDTSEETNRIVLFGPESEPSVQVVAGPDGGLIEVFDTDGGVKASLPM